MYGFVREQKVFTNTQPYDIYLIAKHRLQRHPVAVVRDSGFDAALRAHDRHTTSPWPKDAPWGASAHWRRLHIFVEQCAIIEDAERRSEQSLAALLRRKSLEQQDARGWLYSSSDPSLYA